MTVVQRHLSPADVAELLGVEVRDIMRLVDAGDLPSVTVGDKTRIPERSVEAWLSDRVEVERRAALWQESQTASVVDLFGRRSG